MEELSTAEAIDVLSGNDYNRQALETLEQETALSDDLLQDLNELAQRWEDRADTGDGAPSDFLTAAHELRELVANRMATWQTVNLSGSLE